MRRALHILPLSLACVFLLNVESIAEEQLDRVSIENIVEEVLANNPRIVATQARWEAAVQKVPQARALEDPMFSVDQMIKEPDLLDEMEQTNVMLSQKFPFYGKRGLQAEVAQREADAAHKEYEAIERQVILEVKRAFYDYYYVQESIQIIRDVNGILDRFERISLTKYQTGMGNQQEVLKVQVEISELANRLLLLEQQRGSLVARLNALRNQPPDAPLGPPVTPELTPLSLELTELLDLAKENRQELEAARIEVSRAETQVKLAKKQYYPDVTLSLRYTNYKKMDPTEPDFPLMGLPVYMVPGGGALMIQPSEEPSERGGRDDGLMLGFSVNVPLWRGKLRAAVQEAQAQVRASEFEVLDTTNMTNTEVKDAYLRLITTRDVYELYTGRLIPQAEASLKSAEAGYQTGAVGFLDLLDSERTLLLTRLEARRSLAEHGQALADLERATGVDLNSHGDTEKD